MKLIRASLAVILLSSSIASAEWAPPELSSLENLCIRAATDIEASTAEKARICACAARVIGANVKSAAALEAAGPEAARAVLGTSVGACSYASGGAKSKEEPLSPQARLARIAELKKKGALPTFRGWDLEAAHGYLVQCEAAALRTNPSASVLEHRRYCECTYGWLTVEYKQRGDGEAAIKRFASRSSPPEESWRIATLWTACSHFAYP